MFEAASTAIGQVVTDMGAASVCSRSLPGGLRQFHRLARYPPFAARADPDITYIPIEGIGGIELTPHNVIGDIDPAKRAILKTRFDAIGIPIDNLTLSDKISKLLFIIKRRAQIRQRLKVNDIVSIKECNENTVYTQSSANAKMPLLLSSSV